MQNKFFSRRALAEMLGVSESTLATWASTGRVNIPFVRVGRCVRYRTEDVEAFLAANTVGGAE